MRLLRICSGLRKASSFSHTHCAMVKSISSQSRLSSAAVLKRCGGWPEGGGGGCFSPLSLFDREEEEVEEEATGRDVSPASVSDRPCVWSRRAGVALSGFKSR